MTAPTVSFATLGCRLNQVDSQEIQAALEARGFRTVAAHEPADVVVINTCTVTARAELSDRQAIRRAVRRGPGTRVVVTGCWAQVDPDAIARIGGVDLVVGNADKLRLPALVERLLADDAPERRPWRHVSDVGGQRGLAPAPLAPGNRSRAFVKIQEGCQHRCAFCIVPRARGPSRSREPHVVIDQIRQLVEAGHAEVVLTGVDMGHYGADLTPTTTLAALLRAIVGIPGLRRVRLSSLLPAYFTPELVEVVTGSDRVTPHLHIPLQSGSDSVLRAMRRPYTVAMYRRLVESLAVAIPGLGLGSDLIAGFPGETEDDFARTMRLVSDLPFTYLHVFPYSDRRGTEAASLQGHLASGVVAGRSAELRQLGAAKSLAFRRSLVGRRREVVVLERRERSRGALVGLTGNYVEVIFDGPDAVTRRLVEIEVTAAAGERTFGTLGAVPAFV
ncbi:MAG TPA: tRNA (N(6)-L-threonylcarbamoyladenosine(37)-C(2))-methylthiotransferase MtaB [Methylomirabilota bacterium]|nr:tRNA (N(6)-L-threonylcarbamoyladenosine(37)-C(2))-methylthiotransferase MtaB [Methylomirabilota bacterium]